jgi:DNA polymerase III subunit epsilon
MSSGRPIALPSWLATERFAVFDVESTGLDPEVDRIVQIAVVQVDGGEMRNRWSALVDPTCPIPARASAIHGITDDQIRGAPPFCAIAREIAVLCADRILLGYNAVAFDAALVRAEMRRCAYPVSRRVPIDPLIWVREIDRWQSGRGRHRLETTCARWGVPIARAHDAESDACAAWSLFRKLVEARPNRFPNRIDQLLRLQEQLMGRQREEFSAWQRSNPLPDSQEHPAQ